MKKKFIILASACMAGLAVFLFGIGHKTINDTNQLEKISIEALMMEFDYEELKKESDAIALVECIDDISENSSNLYYDDGMLSGFSSLREVKVLQTYKGNIGDKTSVLEPAAITPEKQLLFVENYNVLEKGKKYILFLSDNTLTGEYGILSGNNGVINVDNMSDNEYFDIAFKGLVEYESELSYNDKNKILYSDVKVDSKVTQGKEIVMDDIDIDMQYVVVDNVVHVNVE